MSKKHKSRHSFFAKEEFSSDTDSPPTRAHSLNDPDEPLTRAHSLNGPDVLPTRVHTMALEITDENERTPRAP